MSEELRTMIREYSELQQMSKELPVLRKKLVAQIKSEGLTKNKFKLNNKITVAYHKYTRPADISLTMIQDTLKELYPNMDIKPFIERLNEKRNTGRNTTETIKTF